MSTGLHGRIAARYLSAWATDLSLWLKIVPWNQRNRAARVASAAFDSTIIEILITFYNAFHSCNLFKHALIDCAISVHIDAIIINVTVLHWAVSLLENSILKVIERHSPKSLTSAKC